MPLHLPELGAVVEAVEEVVVPEEIVVVGADVVDPPELVPIFERILSHLLSGYLHPNITGIHSADCGSNRVPNVVLGLIQRSENASTSPDQRI